MPCKNMYIILANIPLLDITKGWFGEIFKEHSSKLVFLCGNIINVWLNWLNILYIGIHVFQRKWGERAIKMCEILRTKSFNNWLGQLEHLFTLYWYFSVDLLNNIAMNFPVLLWCSWIVLSSDSLVFVKDFQNSLFFRFYYFYVQNFLKIFVESSINMQIKFYLNFYDIYDCFLNSTKFISLMSTAIYSHFSFI